MVDFCKMHTLKQTQPFVCYIRIYFYCVSHTATLTPRYTTHTCMLYIRSHNANYVMSALVACEWVCVCVWVGDGDGGGNQHRKPAIPIVYRILHVARIALWVIRQEQRECVRECSMMRMNVPDQCEWRNGHPRCQPFRDRIFGRFHGQTSAIHVCSSFTFRRTRFSQ